MNALPVPGIAKILSTTNEPVIMKAVIGPNAVTKGINEFSEYKSYLLNFIYSCYSGKHFTFCFIHRL